MAFETFPVAEEHVDGYATLLSERSRSDGLEVDTLDISEFKVDIRKDMNNPELTEFIAKDSTTGKIVAFIIWRYPTNHLYGLTIPRENFIEAFGDKSFIFIKELFVHEEHRRCGIGTQLMQHAIIAADQDNLRICLGSINEAGESLYTKLGFVKVYCHLEQVTYMVKHPQQKQSATVAISEVE
ncbi:acyl-CoA N-acyltransferase [Bisporella sp. PMI_857]|nr:acyl-CoA N-acyltransferase [Bisporella sp. PMI_857]